VRASTPCTALEYVLTNIGVRVREKICAKVSNLGNDARC